MESTTHIRPLLLVWVLQDLPQYVDARLGLDSDTCQQAAFVNVPNQRLGVGLLVAMAGRALCVRGEGSLIVEAIEVTAGIFEVLDPAFWLGNHHVAVEGASAVGGGGFLNVGPDLGHDWGAKGDIGDEMAIPGYFPSALNYLGST